MAVNPGEGAAKPQVSVVIVARDAVATVRDCLDSLRRQRTSCRFEVILIDSSTDGTAELVEREFPEVRLLHFAERKFCGDGRNIGVGLAAAPVVAFVDADCVAAEDWVEALREAHEGPVVAVGGAITNREPSSLTGWAAYFCEFTQWMPGLPARWLDDMAGANLSYKAEVLRELGPFIEGTHCSDTEFHWRLGAAGHEIRFEPTIRVSHAYVGGPLTYLRHEFDHGRSFGRVRAEAGGLRSWRRWAYAIGFPAVAAVLFARVVRRVLAAGSHFRRFLVASPLVAAGLLLWSLGEGAGYLGRRAA
jgi:glycosyltransferase involved in cell wall biosynthesis